MVEVVVVEPREFGTAAASAFLDRANNGSVVGLATGSTPTPLYARLREVGLPPLKPFAIDEYVEWRSHPCTNRTYFEEHWNPIPGAAAVEQFDPEAPDPDAEVERFAAALASAGGLDLVVLGIGLNGHLAFNEPGSSRDSKARLVALAETTRLAASNCWTEETPALGLTLGLTELLAARQVLLLANGNAKAPVVAAALEGGVGPDCPASFLQEHPAARVILDTRAASQLSRR